MTDFTPLSGTIGGLMIGLAAALFLLFNGRIAGISGILGGALSLPKNDFAWRAAFLAGLILGPLLVRAVSTAHPPLQVTDAPLLLIVAGLLVGFGTRLGGGCTSGHGVCGLARFSQRSVAATVIFFVTAAVTVFVVRHLVGG